MISFVAFILKDILYIYEMCLKIQDVYNSLLF